MISVVFFSPVAEEFLHRHILMRILRFLPVYAACMISGLAFYLSHGYSNIGTLFAGTYWAYLYQRDKSLIPCVFLRIARNLFGVAAKTINARVVNIPDDQMLFIYFGLNVAAHFVFFILAMGYLRFQSKRK
jgi:membrane protease YdiL (CAAX protease family)